MSVVYFTFRTLTDAQRAASALIQSGLSAHLTKSPKSISATGCGYAVRVAEADLTAANLVLRRDGIQYNRIYRYGSGTYARETFL